MRRLPLLICLLIAYGAANAQPTQTQEKHQEENTGQPVTKIESIQNNGGGGTEGNGKTDEGGETEGNKASITREESHKEVTVDHGVAQEHHRDEDGDKKHEAVEGDEVDPDDDFDDDNKDEILEVAYRLPEGKPWKEERYTSDWLYSGIYPVLTVEVHWYCPFYIDEEAKEPENKRKRSENTECVTTAHLKYWHQHQDTTYDVLLDTYRITYVPTFVLHQQNVLKYIVPQKVEGNKVTVNVALRYHSDTISCEQFIYEVQDKDKVTITKGENHACKKGDSLTTELFKTKEWGWEEDGDDEDEDFHVEAQLDEKDEDEEEHEHTTTPHKHNHGTQHVNAAQARRGQEHELDASNGKPSHEEVDIQHVHDKDKVAEESTGNKHVSR